MDDLQQRIDRVERKLAAVPPGALPLLLHSTIRDFGHRVVELHFAQCDEIRTVFNIIETEFAASDCVVSRGEFLLPQVFVSDMDSTMIGQECIDELADYAGVKDRVAEITERAMQGELDFEGALRERVRLLDGLHESAILDCLRERISPTPGSRILTQTLSSKGCRTILVTGGFHHFADEIGELIGFERVVGNRLETHKGRLTGSVTGPIVDADTKKAILIEELEATGGKATSLATGDGANDIPLLEAATYGFAYRAKPKAREAANGRIDSPDLTAILSLLGIPREEWFAG